MPLLYAEAALYRRPVGASGEIVDPEGGPSISKALALRRRGFCFGVLPRCTRGISTNLM